MGWLLAFLFLVLAGLLGFLLYGAMNERAALMKRIAELEPKADGHDQALVERQKMAAAYNAMRKRFSGVLDADAEKAKVVAQTKQIAERFNAQLAEAKKKWEAEVALRQSRIATREAAAEAEYAAFTQRCESERTVHYARLTARTAEVEAEIAELKKKQTDELRTIEAELGPLRAEHKALSDEAALVDMGFYRPRHNFVTSERYKKATRTTKSKRKCSLARKPPAAIANGYWMEVLQRDGSTSKRRCRSCCARSTGSATPRLRR
jgi:chromosome segregation ATPase